MAVLSHFTPLLVIFESFYLYLSSTFFLMSMQTNNSKHSFFLFQENSQMFQGRPCKDMSILNEYFPHGITNGASWYNVPGKDHSLTTRIFCSPGCCCLLMIFSSFEKELLFCVFFKKGSNDLRHCNNLFNCFAVGAL